MGMQIWKLGAEAPSPKFYYMNKVKAFIEAVV